MSRSAERRRAKILRLTGALAKRYGACSGSSVQQWMELRSVMAKRSLQLSINKQLIMLIPGTEHETERNVDSSGFL